MSHSYEWQRVVSRPSMQIKWAMRISEGQIIRAILYFQYGNALSTVSLNMHSPCFLGAFCVIFEIVKHYLC